MKTRCPVCESTCLSPPLYRYTVSEAASHFCTTTRDFDRNRRLEESIRKLWGGDECTILRCRICGFGFSDPFVGGDENFYSILHEQNGYPRWRWDYEVGSREIVKKLRKGRILEIGAGEGAFLRRLGKEWQGSAVEASPLTRSQLAAGGFRVYQKLEEVVQDAAGTFHAVVMFQVLEHIAEFQKLLAMCRQLLCNSGLLIATVPDCGAMIRQEKMTGCADMPPNHVNKWTPKSLGLALEKAGFKVEKIVFESPSWRKFFGNLYLRVSADTRNPYSLATQVYRIPIRLFRAPFLVCLGALALAKMMPHLKDLKMGGAFGVVGKIPQCGSST